jgi:predicted short-subunit dehydrogenase-like oxidoreductase (DUF2520 family)
MNVVFIGSGNVATHMAQAFKSAGCNITQVISKTLENAQMLADRVGAIALTDFSMMMRDADFYVISVSDHSITTVAKYLEAIDGIVVHTSGATAMNALNKCRHYGVLYPLQTFSKATSLDFSGVPLFIEASDNESLKVLNTVACRLSKKVYNVNTEQRGVLHLSAVFVCNFVNQLYQLGAELMKDNQLDFEMLRPLIMETAMKVQNRFPYEVQTGPAVRGDQRTINNHLKMLEPAPALNDIYQLLSDSIKKTHEY